MPRYDDPEYLAGLLRELCQLPDETEWCEFKHNNCDPQEIGEYISALSNSAALMGKTKAYLVWGVSDKSHDVVGTKFRLAKTKKGNEGLENWLTHMLKPSIHFRFIEFDLDGNHIAMIEIPQAAHQPVRFNGVEYIRVGSYKKKLKDHTAKERELWRVFDVTPFEQLVAAERIEASEVLTLLDYPAYFKLLEIPLPESRNGILKRLADDHMIETCQGGAWNILNLGAILFASDLSKFRQLARKAVRIIEYDGEGRVKTKREHEEQKGYAAGFENLMAFLKGILPENEVIGAAIRKSVPMYPELAIRELVANVITHQDFTISGTGPKVEVFTGRLEITNPGEPLMDPRLFLGTPPQSRNEALASFLRRIGIGEERGSGVEKIVAQTEFYQLPAPLFEAVGRHTRAVLFAHQPFSKMTKADRTRACYLHACLQYVQHKSMTNRTLRARFGMPENSAPKISNLIRDALDTGAIRAADPDSLSKRHANYVPFWA